MRTINRLVFFLLALIFIPAYSVYSQNIPQPGSLEKADYDIDKDERLEKKITTEKPKEEEIKTPERAPLEGKEKTYVSDIEVRGVDLIPMEMVNKITSQYKDKDLTLDDMQKICDLITDEYRSQGFVTSRAYLPPQTIKDGLLVILVVEGTLGDIEIKGNRWFSTELLKRKIKLKPGDSFDYKSLQKSLRLINEHPDRHAKAVLVPGKEPGTTDIIIEVDDRFPIHLGFEYDNFGSQYVERNRVAFIAEDTNLLGLDDDFYFKYQRADASYFNFLNFRYIVPIFSGTSLGAYYIWDKVKLGKEYKDLKVKGKADIGGLFVSHTLIDEYTVDLRLNAGFDYKRFRNYMLGREVSRDESRIFKGGFDLDLMDNWGRTILTLEADASVPHFLGGMRPKDQRASRNGAGGKFFKLVGYLYRLQPMFWGSTILWKNQFQWSNNTLFASEQFQIGGIANVRAYNPAEYSGDIGYATTIEWSWPILALLPKTLRDIKVPLTETTLNDATRLVLFYDCGLVYNNKYIINEKRHKFINGLGFGFRFNVQDNVAVRTEFAIPLGRDPYDDKDFRTYVGVNVRY